MASCLGTSHAIATRCSSGTRCCNTYLVDGLRRQQLYCVWCLLGPNIACKVVACVLVFHCSPHRDHHRLRPANITDQGMAAAAKWRREFVDSKGFEQTAALFQLYSNIALKSEGEACSRSIAHSALSPLTQALQFFIEHTIEQPAEEEATTDSTEEPKTTASWAVVTKTHSGELPLRRMFSDSSRTTIASSLDLASLMRSLLELVLAESLSSSVVVGIYQLSSSLCTYPECNISSIVETKHLQNLISYVCYHLYVPYLQSLSD